jgi:hypothetical protein
MSERKFLPFRDDMTAAIREGRKWMTSRTKRYGDDGDFVDSPAGPLFLIHVGRRPLSEVAQDFYKAEGFESPEAFEQAWTELHPRRGFQPDDLVWVHTFRATLEGVNDDESRAFIEIHERVNQDAWDEDRYSFWFVIECDQVVGLTRTAKGQQPKSDGRFCHEHVDWEPAHRPASSTEAQEWARSCKR